jgi:hypothetical protein
VQRDGFSIAYQVVGDGPVPGTDHDFWFGDFDPIVDEIERFITGAVQPAEPDRIYCGPRSIRAACSK